MRTVSFTIPGIATPWARAGRKGGFSYTPGKQRTAMADIQLLARRALNGPLLTGPLALYITAFYPWPRSMSAKKRAAPGARWKATRPDLSNLVKLIEDALNGVVYLDDGQIAYSLVAKIYGEHAEVNVCITTQLADLTPNILTQEAA